MSVTSRPFASEEDAYTALGRALAAILEPMVREAVSAALAQHVALAQHISEQLPTAARQVKFATAAQMLDVSPRTVYRLIGAGKLQVSGSGRMARVSVESIESYARGEERT